MLGVISDFVEQNRVLKLPGKHRKVQPLYAIIYAILNSMQNLRFESQNGDFLI